MSTAIGDLVEENYKLKEEIERLNNIIKQYDKVSFIHEMELQKRIDKAIEYIEKEKVLPLGEQIDKLLDILDKVGSDK